MAFRNYQVKHVPLVGQKGEGVMFLFITHAKMSLLGKTTTLLRHNECNLIKQN